MERYNMIVVGAGPAGLSAATARAIRASTVVCAIVATLTPSERAVVTRPCASMARQRVLVAPASTTRIIR